MLDAYSLLFAARIGCSRKLLSPGSNGPYLLISKISFTSLTRSNLPKALPNGSGHGKSLLQRSEPDTITSRTHRSSSSPRLCSRCLMSKSPRYSDPKTDHATKVEASNADSAKDDVGIPGDPLVFLDSSTRIKRRRRRKLLPPSMRLHDGNNACLDWQRTFEMLKGSYDRNTTVAAPESQFSVNDMSLNPSYKNRFPPEPQVWSRESLIAYMRALAALKMSGSTNRSVLDQDITWQSIKPHHRVFYTIYNTLTDPKLRNVLNVQAVNIALLHAYKKQRMDYARLIFLETERLANLPISTWNIMLRACALKKDLWNFSVTLYRMNMRGILADTHTWISFLLVLDSFDAQKTVVQGMKERGLLHNPNVRRAIAQQMCDYYLPGYAIGNKDMKQFWRTMDAEYGDGWMSVQAGNQILAHLLERGTKFYAKAIKDAVGQLKKMKLRGFHANSATMEVLLKACFRSGQENLLLAVLQLFEDLWRMKPDQKAHWRLFQYAWQRRKLYTLRSIWVSARVKRFTTDRMRSRVLDCFLKYRSQRSFPTRLNIFKKRAGRFFISQHPSPRLIPEAKVLDSAETLLWHQKGSIRKKLDFINKTRIDHDLLPCLRDALILDNHIYVHGVPDAHDSVVEMKTINLEEKPLCESGSTQSSNPEAYCDSIMKEKGSESSSTQEDGPMAISTKESEKISNAIHA